MDTPTPRRRWFRFSLMTLLLLALVAVGVAWLGGEVMKPRSLVLKTVSGQ